jgi:acetylornithine deacetylase
MSLVTPTDSVQLLQRMISFNTVNRLAEGILFVEGQLAQYLEQVAQAWGFKTDRLAVTGDAYNLLVSHEVNAQAPWLLFDSHMDTVGVEGMTVPPFAGLVKDGKIWGRGSCDTKGTGAAMLWALRNAVQSEQLSTNIAILFSIEEEVAKTGVNAFAQKQLSQLPWKPVGVVVGEPTQLQLVIAHNGYVRWTIRTNGQAAHSSDPSQGRSAISAMARVITAIERDYVPTVTTTHPLVGKAQCSINVIQGGSQINVIPESCEVLVDRRLVPGEDATPVLPAVKSVLQPLCESDPQLDVEHVEVRIDPPLSPDSNHLLADRVGQVLTNLGFSVEPVGVKYGTNASNHTAGGLPAVVLGPGDIAQAHRADEHLDLDQFKQGINVYQALMRQPACFWEA